MQYSYLLPSLHSLLHCDCTPSHLPAPPLGWYHHWQVMRMNILRFGHHRKQPRPAAAAPRQHYFPVTLFTHKQTPATLSPASTHQVPAAACRAPRFRETPCFTVHPHSTHKRSAMYPPPHMTCMYPPPHIVTPCVTVHPHSTHKRSARLRLSLHEARPEGLLPIFWQTVTCQLDVRPPSSSTFIIELNPKP
jgi:hypothetical protein